ncbi:MAG: dienelactone hydrolase family protein [Ignavibacteria bacterium]|jgi:dienelactone hydrolase|nr:dienelactone hydrolase family protein [Ignavibacteria bacterium]
MKLILIISIFFICSMNSRSEIISSEVEYKIGDLTLQGFIAYDNSSVEKRPGVLIVHQWKGLTDYEKSRAMQLAELGYFAFAADIYGKGVRPTTSEEAGQTAGQFYADLMLFRERLNAGLNELKKQPLVNPEKVAAIGYCFGGGGVLELARSGADLLGVVSFHGSLKPQNPDDAKNIKGRVLVQHGAIDPFVKEEDVIAFKKEMEDAKVDYVLTEYSGAVHSFTMESAGNDVTKGSAYNENADKRSWEAMKIFLKEIFGS